MTNTTFNLPANYWRTGGIYIFGDPTHVSNTIKLFSNTITNAVSGIDLAYNGGDASLSTGIEIGAFGKGNTINNFQFAGIHINAKFSNLKIVGNEISGAITNGNAADVYGIKATYLTGMGNVVAYNKVHNISQAAENGTLSGIYLSNPSGSTEDLSLIHI